MALIRVFSDLHLEFGIDVIKICVNTFTKSSDKNCYYWQSKENNHQKYGAKNKRIFSKIGASHSTILLVIRLILHNIKNAISIITAAIAVA